MTLQSRVLIASKKTIMVTTASTCRVVARPRPGVPCARCARCFPEPVADAAPGMLSLQVAEYVAAASVSADDVAAVKRPLVDLAASVDDQPVGRVVHDRAAASCAGSALGSDDGAVADVLGVAVPAFPVCPGDEAHAAGLSGIPGSLNA